MDYLALYRKYRPSEINDVVGQNEIKKILASSVQNAMITHAYLFSGPRGTGKTTMAKILAKMVNCENLVDGSPCNECASCKNIFNNNDVIEIDAASNNGVDEIRDLREKANLVPSVCKYKVYIIDEVHMLTTQAFNALLKTLEEPPKHVIFILATTEYHKIPLTITSRCQKFQFNKIDNEEIVGRLKKIAELENIKISDEALYEIAKISDGGMRDSINFLDQLRSFNGDNITISDVYDVCGNVSVDEITNLFIDMKNNDVEKVTLFFEKVSLNGKNYNKLFEDIILFLKDVVLYKRNVNRELIKTKIESVDAISKILSVDEIFLIIENINNLMDKLKFVSRQSVVVITNFLLIMYKLNNVSVGNNIEKIVDKKQENIEYGLAFNFTSNENKEKCEFTESNLQTEEIKEEKKINNHIKNKEILVNNALAVADKKIKSNLQSLLDTVTDYLTDKKYAMGAGILIDTKLEVAGQGYLIFTGNYDAIVDKIYNNYRICDDLLTKLFNEKYNFVVITLNEWEKYKTEYIENIQNGKKYNLIDYETSIIEENIVDKEPTIVDKLFELVGEESIEFK